MSPTPIPCLDPQPAHVLFVKKLLLRQVEDLTVHKHQVGRHPHINGASPVVCGCANMLDGRFVGRDNSSTHSCLLKFVLMQQPPLLLRQRLRQEGQPA